MTQFIMARHLRIEYPGAYYHVYSRGNEKRPIFFDDEDRSRFLKILGDASERYSARFHVYCLMPNHYHFILETMLANLSQIMHYINTAYSVYLNLKHDRCGHLFQGRFKAILMDAESYLRTLTMYIHGNPVRGGIVDRPEEFPWSSYQAYLGLTAPPCWLISEIVRGAFGNDVNILKAEHDRYVGLSTEPLRNSEMGRAERIGILGSDEFVSHVRKFYLNRTLDKDDGERPEIARLRVRPPVAEIYSEVISQIGTQNRLAKKITILIAHKNTDYRLKEIGDFFQIGPTAVCVAFRKARDEVASNKSLQDAVAELEARVFGRR